MSQNFTQIQQTFDAALQTVISGTTISGVSQITLYTENDASNFAMLPDITTKLGVRTTLIPAETAVATLGSQGYVMIQGIYSVDVMASLNAGYETASQLCDAILAAFPRSRQFTLGDGDLITVMTSSPAPNVSQGAWLMGKLYARTVIVKWFGYIQP